MAGTLHAAELDNYSTPLHPQLDTARPSLAVESDKQRPQLRDSFRSPECKARELLLSRTLSGEFSPAGRGVSFSPAGRGVPLSPAESGVSREDSEALLTKLELLRLGA